MIQRIQSLYLLAVVALLIVAMSLPVAQYIYADGSVMSFTNLGIDIPDLGRERSCWGMFVILLLSAVVAAATLLLFKNRMLQIRMSIFNMVLLVGYYAAFIAFIVAYNHRLPEASFRLGFAACLPLLALVLNWLALRAIGKDEMMVRAIDRLR